MNLSNATTSQLTSFNKQWLSLCSQLQINGDTQWEKLIHSYSSSGLAYHNFDHIIDCLNQFSSRKNEAQDPTSVEFAIWFHDLVYDPKASDNEEQSARLASKFLANTSIANSVSDLVLATKHSDIPNENDARLICDIDLSILGSSPSRYQKYATAIRQEYSWVSDRDYRSGRTRVLQSFLRRPSIFSLAVSRDRDEAKARNNITSEILQLQSENS